MIHDGRTAYELRMANKTHPPKQPSPSQCELAFQELLFFDGAMIACTIMLLATQTALAYPALHNCAKAGNLKMVRKKVSYLTVVWGEAYIERFAALALPSFLAPGNLPALAAQFDLEVVIMTRKSDIRFFEQHRAFTKLAACCPVRFVEIDDLIAGTLYGVTLTLAYLRPIAAYGPEMLNRHFVFMNADFVLADGSLRALARHIQADRAIVLGPSFRAVAENVEPALHSLVDAASGTLQIEPRKLVKLSLPHPHITTVAKTLNRGLCHTIHPNQFFWKVDDETLLGRYFLIFMLCLKPERIIRTINSYCDYAFIPEMCPSGDEVAMADSDDFFMLELQQRDQEQALVRFGKPSEEAIAQSLQFWTTAEHRRASRFDIVFHSGDLPVEKLQLAKSEAGAFIHRIFKHLQEPKPHQDHYYWTHGLAAWRYHLQRKDVVADPPEIRTTLFGLLREKLKHAALSNSLSMMYASRPLIEKSRNHLVHPMWLDYRHLKKAYHSLVEKTPAGKLLIIQDSTEVLGQMKATIQHATLVHTSSISSYIPPPDCRAAGGYNALALCLESTPIHEALQLINLCKGVMAGSFRVHVFKFHSNATRGNETLKLQLFKMMASLEKTTNAPILSTYTGGRGKFLIARLFSKLSSHYTHYGIVALAWVAPMLAMALPAVIAFNWRCRNNQPSDTELDFCSSIALEFFFDSKA